MAIMEIRDWFAAFASFINDGSKSMFTEDQVTRFIVDLITNNRDWLMMQFDSKKNQFKTLKLANYKATLYESS